ncbi:MAG: histidine phosphatase family protein [Chloroflexi bacterium]|nr:histidine phosphatase family protein [Chloroflexota bacterium]
MTTTLLLIRHGITDWNEAGRWQGHADIPLNETGRQQAAQLAVRLSDWPIEAVISSDLQRCRQTAVVLATHHHLEPHFDAIWRERDVGDFSGMTSKEVRARFSKIGQNGKRGLIDPPNGEPFHEVRRRAQTAYEKVLADHPNEMVAVVSHGGLLHSLIGQLIGLHEDEYGRFSLRGNTGLSIVEVINKQPYLTRLNDTSHLELVPHVPTN